MMNVAPSCAKTELGDEASGIEHMQMLETGLCVLLDLEVSSDLPSPMQIIE
jgi:hypothetical protein